MALVLGARQKRLLPVGKLKIDWSHPLANGLVACYVPGVSGGINLTGLGGDLALLTAANNSDSTQEGPSFKTSTSVDGLQALAPAAFLNNTGSLYWRGWYTGGGSDNGATLIGTEYNNAGGAPYLYHEIGIQFAAPNTLLTQWNTNGSYTGASAGFALTQNSFLSCGATFKPGGNTVSYISGAAYNTTAFGASNPTSSATTTVCLHTNTADLTRPMHASCNIACIWNRDLSAAEMALIDADPYCFLIPAEGEMPALFIPSVGGSFLAAWARGSNLPVIGTGNY